MNVNGSGNNAMHQVKEVRDTWLSVERGRIGYGFLS